MHVPKLISLGVTSIDAMAGQKPKRSKRMEEDNMFTNKHGIARDLNAGRHGTARDLKLSHEIFHNKHSKRKNGIKISWQTYLFSLYIPVAGVYQKMLPWVIHPMSRFGTGWAMAIVSFFNFLSFPS
jgi:hypothetical protein